MDSVVSSTVGLVQRLAATLPTPSEDQSSLDAIQQFSGEFTNPSFRNDLLVLTIVVVLALELLSQLVYHLPPKPFGASSIPVRGKHLDHFSWKDWHSLQSTSA